MKRWRTELFAFLLGGMLVFIGERLIAPRMAQAQNLSKFQHVTFDFATTGQVSTLTFFNRDTGEIVLYVAGAGGDFKAARRLRLTELGAPLAPYAGNTAPNSLQLQLPFGTESGE